MKTIFLKSRKNVLKMTLLASLALPIMSCSKDDDNNNVAPQNQNPVQDVLSEYLETAGFTSVTEYKNSTDYEFGISFKPTENGKITEISAKIPDTRTGLRITFWDKAAGTVIRSETIDITAAGEEVTKAISGLSVVKNKEYMFTFNSNDWYNHRTPDAADITYPIVSGDIDVTGYAYSSGTAQVMPTIKPNYYYAGDINFKFQKD